MRQLGPFLRRMQLELGLRQREFAEELGVSPSCLSLWQRGRRKPGRFAKRGILVELEERWPNEFSKCFEKADASVTVQKPEDECTSGKGHG